MPTLILTNLALSCLALLCLVLSCLVLSPWMERERKRKKNQTPTGTFRTTLQMPTLILTNLALSCLALLCLVLSCRVLSPWMERGREREKPQTPTRTFRTTLQMPTLILTNLALSCLALLCLVLSFLVLSCLVSLSWSSLISTCKCVEEEGKNRWRRGQDRKRCLPVSRDQRRNTKDQGKTRHDRQLQDETITRSYISPICRVYLFCWSACLLILQGKDKTRQDEAYWGKNNEGRTK
jgi:hypothetical protein